MLEKELPIPRERRVDFCGGVHIALKRARKMLLAGKVAAIPDPECERPGTQDLTDLDAVEVVGDRLVAHGRVGVRQTAKFVGERLTLLVLKRIGIYGVKSEAERACVRFERVGLRAVTGYAQRDD